VLLVDDDADNREIYALALETLGGYRVTVASDGQEGLTRALLEQPDVIVSDYSMPGMDGGELVLRLAGDDLTRKTPVVLVSGFHDEVPAQVRALCAAVLTRPCLPEDLLRALTIAMATQPA
jgi:CheY-like chemotaxis protein